MLRLAVCLALAAATLSAQQTAGVRPNGSAILPNGWPLTPAGKQIPLSTLPMSLALSPGGTHALVLNGGFLQPSVSVVDLATERETSRVELPDGWLGLRFNRAGDKVYVGGGARGSVLELEFHDGKLQLAREFSTVQAAARSDEDFVGDVLLSEDEGLIYAANLFRDSVSVLNAKSGFLLREFSVRSRPYRMLLAPDGEHVWISHWGESSVGLYNLAEGRLIENLRTGGLPSDMVLVPGAVELPEEENFPVAARLFIACSNTNSVWSFGLTESNRVRLFERINVGPSLIAPAGSAPTALSVSPDGKRLMVAASGNNRVVIAEISEARAVLTAAVPTGWYPTAAAETGDGRLIYVNGKGLGSRPIPQGPNPTRREASQQYMAAMQTGSLGILPAVDESTFAALTERAVENQLYDDEYGIDPRVPAGNPVTKDSPIRHVVYVIKENRTFDQILGDLEGANGDGSLVVFDESVAPNHRRLARQFVLLDNFYAPGDSSADGQNWATSATSTDFVEKLWPSRAGRRLKLYPFEAGEPAAIPPAGYLWSNAVGAGLKVKTYGLRSEGDGTGFDDPGLDTIAAANFPAFDLSVPDGRRVELFLQDFRAMSEAGDLPRLMVIRLGGDHTAGGTPGLPTARAMMAEHDLALGRLVEGVSRTEAWPKAAVFIVEDDAQDGADHVDSHRTVALVASPYAKRGVRDSTFYSTPSMLRTIELILGLQPMSQFDAASTPMWQTFQPEPNLTPYEAVEPMQDPDERNPEGSGGLFRRVHSDAQLLAEVGSTPVE